MFDALLAFANMFACLGHPTVTCLTFINSTLYVLTLLLGYTSQHMPAAAFFFLALLPFIRLLCLRLFIDVGFSGATVVPNNANIRQRFILQIVSNSYKLMRSGPQHCVSLKAFSLFYCNSCRTYAAFCFSRKSWCLF